MLQNMHSVWEEAMRDLFQKSPDGKPSREDRPKCWTLNENVEAFQRIDKRVDMRIMM